MRIPTLRLTVLVSMSLAAALVTWSWHHHRSATSNTRTNAEAVELLDDEAVPVTSATPASILRAASIAVEWNTTSVRAEERESLAVASDASDSTSEMQRELVAAEQRAVIGSVWGLTEEQQEAFDVATGAPSQERQDVMMQYANGRIAEKDLDAELEQADERGLQQVREVLGEERFNEYLSIRWRFEADEPDVSPST